LKNIAFNTHANQLPTCTARDDNYTAHTRTSIKVLT